MSPRYLDLQNRNTYIATITENQGPENSVLLSNLGYNTQKKMVQLLRKHNFVLESKFVDEIDKNQEQTKRIKNAVISAWYKYHGSPKGDEAAMHDALNYALIRHYQNAEKSGLTTDRGYFLTADQSLNELPHELDESELGSFCIYGNALLEMTFPFVTLDVAKQKTAEIYARMFSSRYLYPVVKMLEFPKVSRVLRPWMADEELDGETLLNIIEDSYVDEVLDRQEKMAKDGLESDRKELDNALFEAYKRQLKTKLEQEVTRPQTATESPRNTLPIPHTVFLTFSSVLMTASVMSFAIWLFKGVMFVTPHYSLIGILCSLGSIAVALAGFKKKG